jgi:hypothetical protein
VQREGDREREIMIEGEKYRKGEAEGWRRAGLA